ncbi:MAG: DUF2304 domain-containing protein [Clostridium sp.]|nr:DUF2304 domain-containing protein [Acetatifactor muris]MCM1526257.1 DUF2304 domain-containing protein [Bacteroides sp.]MCM1562926.1 DUF2304 domain-containing protein [Clostridium sp.]
MEPGVMLQIIMIVAGGVLLAAVVSSLAKRKMTESFCLTWGVIAIIIILAGILLRPAEWNRYISGMGLLLLLMIGFCIIYGAYFMSTKVSELSRKNQELAMQVSLLNHEKDELYRRLDELAGMKGGKAE